MRALRDFLLFLLREEGATYEEHALLFFLVAVAAALALPGVREPLHEAFTKWKAR